jgi:hypothetical protein
MTVFQKYNFCNKCAGPNKLVKTYTDGGFIEEAETVCESCGFKDHWAHGFFESGSVMESKAKTYTVRRGL